MKRLIAMALLGAAMCMAAAWGSTTKVPARAQGSEIHAGARSHRLPPLWVTGYDLTGRMYSGILAGPGYCAADRGYIPQGARIYIPKLHLRCVVEDTGVGGWSLDVWRPTAAMCYAITGTYYGVTAVY